MEKKKSRDKGEDRRQKTDLRYGHYLPDNRISLRRAIDILSELQEQDTDETEEDDSGSTGRILVERFIIEQQRQRVNANMQARLKEHKQKQGQDPYMLSFYNTIRNNINGKLARKDEEQNISRKANHFALSNPEINNSLSPHEKIMQWQKSIQRGVSTSKSNSKPRT